LRRLRRMRRMSGMGRIRRCCNIYRSAWSARDKGAWVHSQCGKTKRS
jgi:hypothetical protein